MRAARTGPTGYRLSKVASGSADGFGATDWGEPSIGGSSGLGFVDGSRPLTVDLGCGFGVGPLIYADDDTLWRGENLLGCDLSATGIGYARAVASRWGVGGTCRFARADARATLRAVRNLYPAGVHRVVLSCPTPYAQLEASASGARAAGREGGAGEEVCTTPLASGNSQLPLSAADPSFLGHAEVFADISATIAPGGLLYLASNVEDVAVTLKRTAERHGFEALTSPSPEAAMAGGGEAQHRSATPGVDAADAPLRQQRWHTIGGERADGACWRAAQKPMPWASETERTHQLEGRAVHRVVCKKL